LQAAIFGEEVCAFDAFEIFVPRHQHSSD